MNGIPLCAMTIPRISPNKVTYTITIATYDRIRHLAIDRLKTIILISNIGITAVSIVTGWLVSKKTLKPIKNHLHYEKKKNLKVYLNASFGFGPHIAKYMHFLIR
ncbi:hypothetical protein [Bacillus sp. 3255]|uniref:hypothetical protein n=1 Tax=Bacillus sp. 3255 TaxID=2817904 RepID=UPI00285595F3|nr:hypothetical protein [Bacillus sp. 3255]MDR6884328.1 hypothetical protein [Bacillus sp. 3255]